jgi:hypothetical protein
VTQPHQVPNPVWVAPEAVPDDGPVVAPTEFVASATISEERARQLRLRQRHDTVFPIRLRPMRLVDVLDGAFAVLKAQPRAVTLLIMPMVLPICLLQAYLSRDAANTAIVDFLGSSGRFGRVVDGQRWSLAVYLLDLFALSLAGVVMGKMLARWFDGSVPDAWPVLRASLRLAPSAVAASVLVHLIEAVAAIGFAIGTLLVIPLLCLTSPVIGVENVGPIAAIRRSWRLTARRYRHSCAFVLFSASVVVLLGLLFGWLPSTIAAELGDGSAGWVVVGVASVTFGTVTTAFIALASVIFYLDLRVRIEGMDIEMNAADLFPRA